MLFYPLICAHKSNKKNHITVDCVGQWLFVVLKWVFVGCAYILFLSQLYCINSM